jgi:GT2 family glycosyltransferase
MTAAASMTGTEPKAHGTSHVDLSVIIVTYNSRGEIGACLDSLEPALQDLRADICVVDNASQDGTAALVGASHPGVRLIESGVNGGFAAGVNRGLRETTGRFVLWLNPDARFAGGHITDVIAWMRQHPDVGIVGGRLLDPDGSVQRSVRTFPSYAAVLGARHSLLTRWFPHNPFSVTYLRGDISYREPAQADWVSGACLLHRREVSEAIGGPDDGFFMYFEDVDFCYRAAQRGWTTWFHPGFTFEHHIGRSSEPERFRMLVARHRSLWRWYTKHFRRMWVKDAAVWCGVWVRCGVFMAASWWRRPTR